MEVVITKSKKPQKKFDARIDERASASRPKTVSFGEKGASDFTKHKDKERQQAYVARHKKKEDWGVTGVKAAGFWSANFLWNKPTLKASIDDINKRLKSLNVKIK